MATTAPTAMPLPVPPGMGGAQIYVTLPQKGNSTRRGKSGALEMKSFRTGIYQCKAWIPGDVQAQNVVAPVCEHYVFTRAPDQASAELNIACAKGTVLPKVDIEVYTSLVNDKPIIAYTLHDAIVLGVQLEIGPGQLPHESLTFVCRETEWAYADPKGNPSRGKFNWLELK